VSLSGYVGTVPAMDESVLPRYVSAKGQRHLQYASKWMGISLYPCYGLFGPYVLISHYSMAMKLPCKNKRNALLGKFSIHSQRILLELGQV
jgi:hypothetical protein